MTNPDEIYSGPGELAVLLYIIKNKDKDNLLRLYEDLFFNKDCKSLYNEYVLKGVVSIELFREHLKYTHKDGLLKFLNDGLAFGHDILVSDEEDLYAWIDTLEDYYMKRKLCSIGNEVLEKIDQQEPSSKIIDYIDGSLGTMFIRKGSTSYNTSNKILKAFESSPALGIATGIVEFDSVTGGLVKGGLVSVGGVTGNMKTTSAIDLMRNILRVNPTMTGILFEIEMNDQELAIDLLGHLGLNRTELIKSKIPMETIKEKIENDPLKERFAYYTSEGDGINTVADIIKLVLKHKPDIWGIDYMGQLILNESMVTKRDGSGSNYNRFFMETMHKLKILAQRTNSIGIVIHQADAKVNKFRKDPRPKIEDIEWSQDLVRLSSAVYMCYYPCKYFQSEDPETFRKIFIQIWHKMRFAQSSYNIMEVDPTTGIFRSPSPRVRQMGESHINGLKHINEK